MTTMKVTLKADLQIHSDNVSWTGITFSATDCFPYDRILEAAGITVNGHKLFSWDSHECTYKLTITNLDPNMTNFDIMGMQWGSMADHGGRYDHFSISGNRSKTVQKTITFSNAQNMHGSWQLHIGQNGAYSGFALHGRITVTSIINNFPVIQAGDKITSADTNTLLAMMHGEGWLTDPPGDIITLPAAHFRIMMPDSNGRAYYCETYSLGTQNNKIKASDLNSIYTAISSRTITQWAFN